EGTTATLPDGVDLVDEDDGRGPLARVGEQVTHAGGADPDEQLDEAGTGEGQERHSGLTGHGPGHQGLAGARWPHHEHAARADRPGAGVALWIAEEVDHFGDFLFRALV